LHIYLGDITERRSQEEVLEKSDNRGDFAGLPIRMGNTPRTSRGKDRDVRVLLPDGNVVYLDEPVEAVDLMIQHKNHMVIYCSTAKSGAMGTRPSMRIMAPDEMLQPGQAYVVHHIPHQTDNKRSRSKPQPLSIPNISCKVATVQSRRDKANSWSSKKQEPAAEPRNQRHSRRGSSKVADSTQSPKSKSEESEVKSELLADARHGDGAHSKEPDNKQEDPVVEEEDDDILLNLKLYMGWRPALESIPESPLGYNHSLDMMQAPPVLCG
jgi:hypothetical protein